MTSDMRNIINLLNESDNPGTVALYHGGKDLEYYYRELRPAKKNRGYHGVGIYLTNRVDVAEKYAKGSRALYQVDIQPGNEISNVWVNTQDAVDFLMKIVSRRRLKSYTDYMEKYEQGTMPIGNIVNLVINNDDLKPKSSVILRQFLIDNGVDYEITSAHGSKIVVVINPAVIKNVSRVKVSDINPDNYETDISQL